MSQPEIAAPPDPSTTDIKFSCAAGCRWAETWPLPMSIFEFSRRMKRVASCPACGAKAFLGWPQESANA